MTNRAGEEADPFAELRATPDKAWTTLLSILGELRDANIHQRNIENAIGRIEKAVHRLQRAVEFGIVIGVGIALYALYS